MIEKYGPHKVRFVILRCELTRSKILHLCKLAGYFSWQNKRKTTQLCGIFVWTFFILLCNHLFNLEQVQMHTFSRQLNSKIQEHCAPNQTMPKRLVWKPSQPLVPRCSTHCHPPFLLVPLSRFRHGTGYWNQWKKNNGLVASSNSRPTWVRVKTKSIFVLARCFWSPKAPNLRNRVFHETCCPRTKLC